MQEIWKDIPEYEGLYQVSNLGRIKSLPRKGTHTTKERIMNFTKSNKGYFIAVLSKDYKKKSFSVHRLVAQAFIPNPNNLPQVNHKDENKENNNINNLEWCSNWYNTHYGNHLHNLAMKLKWKNTKY